MPNPALFAAVISATVNSNRKRNGEMPDVPHLENKAPSDCFEWGGLALVLLLVIAIFAICSLTGCNSPARAVTESASGKNLDLSGYVMLGELETANNETLSPQGRMILGRVTYKSRKVGIPADQKVPNSGNFRATKSKSLFGTEDIIIEYDWTAGSDADAIAAEQKLQGMKAEAERCFEEDGDDGKAAVEPETN